MTTADPAPPAVALPPLSIPVERVTFTCPHCGKPRAFRSEKAQASDPQTRPVLCECGAYLGQYEVSKGGRRLLRLAGA